MAAQQQKDNETVLPVVFDRDAVLTIEQVAAGLGVKSIATVEKMHLPFTYIGGGTMKRIRWGRVLDILDQRGKSAA